MKLQQSLLFSICPHILKPILEHRNIYESCLQVIRTHVWENTRVIGIYLRIIVVD